MDKQPSNEERRPASGWLSLFFILCLLMPVLFLLTMPGGTMMGGIFWFWLILLLCFWMIGSMVAVTEEEAGHRQPERQLRMLSPEEQPDIIRRLMDVRLATEKQGVSVFRGPLLGPADQALDDLQRRGSAGEADSSLDPLVALRVDVPDDDLGRSTPSRCQPDTGAGAIHGWTAVFGWAAADSGCP